MKIELTKIYEVPRTLDEEGLVWYSCLSSVAFASSQVGWVVGSQQILFTSDGGGTWINQFPYGSEVGFLVPHRVSAVTREICWVLAITSASEFRCGFTLDGGTTWKARHAGAEHPNDIFFIDSQCGWVLTDDGKALSKAGAIHSTTDGGRKWIRHGVRLNGKPDRVRFSDHRRGFILLRVADKAEEQACSELLVTDDGGWTWQIARVFNKRILDLFILTGESLFIVGENGLLASSIDGGQTWTELREEFGGSINAITFLESRTGIATGDEGLVLVSQDAGLNWDPCWELQGGDNIVGAHFTSPTEGILVSSAEILRFRITANHQSPRETSLNPV